jgi:hypothetical protein
VRPSRFSPIPRLAASQCEPSVASHFLKVNTQSSTVNASPLKRPSLLRRPLNCNRLPCTSTSLLSRGSSLSFTAA